MSIETTHSSKEIDTMFSNVFNDNFIDGLKKSEKCRLIRDYNYSKLYNNIYPDSYKNIILTDSPMLCLRMKSLDNKEQIELWKSDEYIAEEKIDGIRCYLVYDKDYPDNNGYEVFSRENDEETLLPLNITDLINLNLRKPEFAIKSFLLDCELVFISKNNYKFYALDCLSFNDKIIIDETWRYRNFVTNQIVTAITDKKITYPLYQRDKKIEFFNYIKSKNGEGVVIKNINSKYLTKGTRSKNNWIKAKGNICDYSIIDDTLEGYVSTPLNNDNDITLSGFINDNDVPQKIAIIPKDYIRYLTPSFLYKNISIGLGSVIEFSSPFFSYKDNIFFNPVPIKIRTDKSIKDCSYSKNDINKWSA